MDEDDTDRLFQSFLPMLLEGEEDGGQARRLLLKPLQVDEDHVAAFGALVWRSVLRTVWAGAQVNGTDVQNSTRLDFAREYWAYYTDDAKFRAQAGLYVLDLEEGDRVVCHWGENVRTEWIWSEGSLRKQNID